MDIQAVDFYNSDGLPNDYLLKKPSQMNSPNSNFLYNEESLLTSIQSYDSLDNVEINNGSFVDELIFEDLNYKIDNNCPNKKTVNIINDEQSSAFIIEISSMSGSPNSSTDIIESDSLSDVSIHDQNVPNVAVTKLPPCRICKMTASGMHYGVNTCEACKGFFRRCLKKNPVACSKDGICMIDGRKNQCSACRYKKCITLGMSKSAIKTGRYTHERRADLIREIKGEHKSKAYENQNKLSKRNDNIPIKAFEKITSCLIRSHIDIPLSSDLVDCQDECLHLITAITNAHNLNTFFTPEFLASVPQSEALCLDRMARKFNNKKAMEDLLGGELKVLSHNEYMDVLNKSDKSIQIDNRLEFITGNITHDLLQTLVNFTNFCNSVPGFLDLDLEDRIKLIKMSNMTCWLIGTQQCVNVKEKLFTNSNCATYHEEEMCQIGFSDWIKDFFHYSDMIQKLNLTTEEICLLRVLIIFLADTSLCMFNEENCSFVNEKILSTYQEKCLKALRLYLNMHYPLGGNSRFAALINVLTELRTAYFKYSQVIDGFKEITKDSHVPSILQELWS